MRNQPTTTELNKKPGAGLSQIPCPGFFCARTGCGRMLNRQRMDRPNENRKHDTHRASPCMDHPLWTLGGWRVIPRFAAARANGHTLRRTESSARRTSAAVLGFRHPLRRMALREAGKVAIPRPSASREPPATAIHGATTARPIAQEMPRTASRADYSIAPTNTEWPAPCRGAWWPRIPDRTTRSFRKRRADSCEEFFPWPLA